MGKTRSNETKAAEADRLALSSASLVPAVICRWWWVRQMLEAG